MKAIGRMIPALLVLGMFIGCVDYDERLTLNSDGSGRIEMRMAVDMESYETIRSLSDDMGDSDSPFAELDRVRIERSLKESGSKAKLEQYSEHEEGGDKVWEIAFSFKSTDDLVDISRAMDDEEGEVPFTFEKISGGGWLFRRDLEQQGGSSSSSYSMGEGGMEIPDMGEIDPQNFDPEKMQAQMEEMMKNMEKMQKQVESHQAKIEEESVNRHIRFSVEFPGDVVESNATKVQGKTAVWEYRFNDLQKMNGEIPALTARVK